MAEQVEEPEIVREGRERLQRELDEKAAADAAAEPEAVFDPLAEQQRQAARTFGEQPEDLDAGTPGQRYTQPVAAAPVERPTGDVGSPPFDPALFAGKEPGVDTETDTNAVEKEEPEAVDGVVEPVPGDVRRDSPVDAEVASQYEQLPDGSWVDSESGEVVAEGVPGEPMPSMELEVRGEPDFTHEPGEEEPEEGEQAAAFDAGDYEDESLKLEMPDGRRVHHIRIAFSGSIDLNRAAPDDVALIRRLSLGDEVSFAVDGSVDDISHQVHKGIRRNVKVKLHSMEELTE